MGTDICAWIEVREAGRWTCAVDNTRVEFGRNYDVFGCLFGVRNYANFSPLFAGRGLPADVSEKVKSEAEGPYTDECYGHTWASYEELCAIDFDELTLWPDSRIHIYEVKADGTEVCTGKAAEMLRHLRPGGPHLRPGEEIRKEGKVYRTRHLTRGEVLNECGPDGEGFPAVLASMKPLADRHGPENVRLVVWFGD
jgi:hypothetical protein